MKWICLKNISITVVSLIATQSFSSQITRTIYGLASAQHFQTERKGSYYIQLGSFSSKLNASNFQKNLQLKTKTPIFTDKINIYYRVAVGPLSSAEEVRSMASLLSSSPLVTKKFNRPKIKKQLTLNNPAPVLENKTQKTRKKFKLPSLRSTPLSGGNWFISAGLGAQFPQFQSNMRVNNGSNFPAPYDEDLYATNTPTEVLLGIGIGRRWYRDSLWLPAFSLGALYQHFFSGNFGGTIMQNSLPEFTNYNYNWKVSSDTVLATAKLNLIQYRKFSPFINAGVGGAFNSATSYNETALSGITARISPDFANKTNGNFSYNAGAGLDYKLLPQLILSFAYLYQDLGNVASGNGTQTWSAETLSLGSYRTNNVFISANYLFNQ